MIISVEMIKDLCFYFNRATIAAYAGVHEQTVSLWLKNRGKCPSISAKVLRSLYERWKLADFRELRLDYEAQREEREAREGEK